MSSYNNLKTAIKQVIKRNGKGGGVILLYCHY